MAVFEFEKQLYADPDQDLNSLWWNTVHTYQLLNKPEGRHEPDWASKIHFALAPCSYHNYLLGELLALQFRSYLARRVLGADSEIENAYVSQKAVGDYLRESVFQTGALYDWRDTVQRATGEPLTPRSFIEQFCHVDTRRCEQASQRVSARCRPNVDGYPIG